MGQSQNIDIAIEQNLSFGDFYFSGNTGGGTITLSNNGEWSATGNIHQLRSNHQPAVFNISTDSQTPVNVGVIILTRTLTNPNGNDISVDPLDSRIKFYKIQKGFPARVFVGGNLKIIQKTQNYQGDYKGSISIIASVYNE